MDREGKYFVHASSKDCFKLKIIGCYLTILFFASLISNSTQIFIYIRKKRFSKPESFFIVSLIVFNLIATIVELPTIAINAFFCRHMFGKIGCDLGSSVMFGIGCINIYLMTVISIERYWVARADFVLHSGFTMKQKWFFLFFCFGISLFWAIAPLLGWSHYSLEGALITCSIEWVETSLNVVSFKIAILLFVYVLPVIVIISTNTKMVLTVIKSRRSLEITTDTLQLRKRIKKEKKLTKYTIIMIVLFLTSWTPYALVSTYATFANRPIGVPILNTVASVFCKSSLLWPSTLNMIANKDYRLLTKPRDARRGTFSVSTATHARITRYEL